MYTHTMFPPKGGRGALHPHRVVMCPSINSLNVLNPPSPFFGETLTHFCHRYKKKHVQLRWFCTNCAQLHRYCLYFYRTLGILPSFHDATLWSVITGTGETRECAGHLSPGTVNLTIQPATRSLHNNDIVHCLLLHGPSDCMYVQ